jgi:hypothetical protein
VSLQYAADAASSLAVDGAPYGATLAAGQNGDYTFSGTIGQRLGLGIGNLTTTPSGQSILVSLIAPDKATTVVNCNSGYGYVSPGGACVFPALPSTGTYTVRVVPSGATAASFTLTLSSEVTGALVANGATTTFSTTRAGQNARYSFNATAGQNASLTWSGVTFAGTWTYLHILKPDGTELAAPYFGAGYNNAAGSVSLPNLPATGTYTVLVQPYPGSTGQVSIGLLIDTINALPPDGTAVAVSLLPWQAVDYTFAGTTGQRVGLFFDQMLTNPTGQTITITVTGPNNLPITSCDPALTYCWLPSLPLSGTYTVRLQSTGAYSATMNLSTDTPITPVTSW